MSSNPTISVSDNTITNDGEQSPDFKTNFSAEPHNSLFVELESRGFVHNYTDAALFNVFEKGGQSLYIGVDPTSDSMQLGNLIALMNAFHFMKRGNKLVLVVGGATGMIGNPSGKDNERTFLDEETVTANAIAIESQMLKIANNINKRLGYDFDIEVVNNNDRHKQINHIEFQRMVGKFMTVNWMMNKDIVRKRINDPDLSISYAEFSYMLIMAYDFLYLFREKGVTLQVGGSDETDGILAGKELIRKTVGNEAQTYGMTNPLITDSKGKKFGKSEGNAIRLDENKNSPYYVYQYLLKIDDKDVAKLLKLLTFFSLDEIQEIMQKHEQNKGARFAQKQLAQELLSVLFGEQSAKNAEQVSELLFGEESVNEKLHLLNKSELETLQRATQATTIDKNQLPISIKDLLVRVGIATSNRIAHQLIVQNSIAINGIKCNDPASVVSDNQLIGSMLLIKKGKEFKSVIFE